MARQRRVRIPGVSQHVIQRGNNRMAIFRCDGDYEVFRAIVRVALMRYPVSLHGYALMPNHVHFVLTPENADALALAMKLIGVCYVHYFNRRYARTGGLFEGRYRSSIIDSDVYWLRCLRYVELNPVRAKLVESPEVYRWTSHAANAYGMPDALVTRHWLVDQLGDGPADCVWRWRQFCADGDVEDDLAAMRTAFHAGRRLGSQSLP